MQFFCTSHKGFRNLKSNNLLLNNLFLIALGTSGLSKFINMKRLDIKIGKERQCHITKQLMHSFEVNIRICQPLKVMFTSMNITILGLTNPDVNLKRMHYLYNVSSNRAERLPLLLMTAS